MTHQGGYWLIVVVVATFLYIFVYFFVWSIARERADARRVAELREELEQYMYSDDDAVDFEILRQVVETKDWPRRSLGPYRESS